MKNAATFASVQTVGGLAMEQTKFSIAKQNPNIPFVIKTHKTTSNKTFTPITGLGKTPIKTGKLESLLARHPNRDAVRKLMENLKKGHKLHYSGPTKSRCGENLLSVRKNPNEAMKKIMKEVELGRVAGPYNSTEETGLGSLIISPIGLVPKQTGGCRLIHHLSFPWGNGINAFIDDEQSKVKFAKCDEALENIARLGKNTTLAKLDVKSAYRLLPIQEPDFRLLGFHLGKKIFVEKMVPNGSQN